MKKIAKTIFMAMIFFALSLSSIAGPQEDLILACKQGNLENVKTAIAAGAVVNQLDAAGVTPLVYAVMWPDIVSYLLESGADPNMGNNTALINAVIFYSVDVIKLLLANGAEVDKGIITPGNDPAAIYKKMMADEVAKGKSANKKQIKIYEDLIAGSPAPSSEYRLSPLEYAVGNSNCVECVKLLLDAGAKTDCRDQMEKGNLIYTIASSAHEPQVRIDGWKAAMPTYENSYGYKFPDWFKNLDGTRCGKAEDILEMLLKKDIDVNDTNTTYGYTALGRALYYKKLSIAAVLLKNGADPKIPCKYFVPSAKTTVVIHPICLAAEVGNLEVMKLMIEKGANINTTTGGISLQNVSGLTGGENFTPLTLAITNKKPDVAAYLIEQGANVNIGVEGSAWVAAGGIPDKIDLKCFIQVTKKTPLYWAIEFGSVDLVNLIGSKMGWKCDPGYTIKVVGGTTTDVINQKQYTCVFKKTKYSPSEWASELGFKDISSLLDAKGL